MKLFITFLLFLSSLLAAGVIGIDYGTDYFKVALVKPGVPLEIVLNKDSKRKTEAILTFEKGHRYFGSDAVNKGLRFPQDSYGKLKNLLGRSFNDPIAEMYRKIFDNTMLEDPSRSTCLFQDGEQQLTVEELIAHQLAYAKKQVELYAGEPIKDAVVTVPPYWTQHERQSLLDACDLAGLRVLSLMHDQTAVAMNYAMTREFTNQSQYHIFYDMGAGSTVASLIKFQSVPIRPESKQMRTQIEVKAIGYDRTLGGNVLDIKLQQHLAKIFVEKHGKKTKSDITKDKRAMAKLLKEANRVKHFLSANTEAHSSVEGLFENIDFKTKVSRTELEELTQDYQQRLLNPIEQVLKQADMKLDEIQSFVLVGGGMRVPFVQNKLQEKVGDKIARHVDADEAAVLGAALKAAILSPSFRVKETFVKDIVGLPVQLKYTIDKEEKNVAFLKATDFLDTKKKMTFNRKEDFEFSFAYDNSVLSADPDFGPLEIAKFKISGVTELLKNQTEEVESKIKVLISISPSGMISVLSADLEQELKPGQAGFFDSLFGKDEKQAKKNETQIKTFPLNVTSEILAFKPLTAEQKEEILKRMQALDDLDTEREALAAAMNQLESFIYSIPDFLEQSAIKEVVSDQQAQDLQKLLKEAHDWLEEEGWKEGLKKEAFEKWTLQIQEHKTKMEYRVKEKEERQLLNQLVSKLEKRIEEMKNSTVKYIKKETDDKADKEKKEKEKDLPEEEKITPLPLSEKEVDDLNQNFEQFFQFYQQKVNEQSKLKLHEDPIFQSKDIKKRIDKIEKQIEAIQTKITGYEWTEKWKRKERKRKKEEEIKRIAEEAIMKKKLEEELKKNQTNGTLEEQEDKVDSPVDLPVVPEEPNEPESEAKDTETETKAEEEEEENAHQEEL